MKTNSISFPHMFDVARNIVGVLEDNISIVNRSRLLILTEPTEIYDNPNQGVGLRRHLWHYNNENERTLIKARIIEQLKLHEPCVDAEKTSFSDGLLFTGSPDELSGREADRVKMTVGLRTIFNDQVEVEVDGKNETGA